MGTPQKKWTLKQLKAGAEPLHDWVRVEVFAELPSTSAWLKENLPDVPTLVIAWEQTAGYGQQGRAWRMRPGQDLAFSLFMPGSGPVPPALTPWLAFHLREQLQRWTAAPLWHKWPNDLHTSSGKVSGTLVERVRNGLIIGTGINWWGEPAQGASLGASVLPWTFLDQWVSWMLKALPAFTPEVWQKVLPRWADHDRFAPRQPVRLSDGREAVYLGPDGEGRLQLWLGGRLVRLSSGGLSVVEPVGQPGDQLRPQGEDDQHQQL